MASLEEQTGGLGRSPAADDEGLLSRQAGEEGRPPIYGFHELVRERVRVWMEAHPDDRGGKSETEIQQALDRHYGTICQTLMAVNREGARDQALEAGRRGLAYLCRARDFDAMGSFVSNLVTGTRDPRLLLPLIAELEAVADQVPAGKARWSLQTYLADALRHSGQPERSLSLYERAAAEAEAAGNWSDVGWITGNWAVALGDVGNLDVAREMYLRSADAERRAGSPAVNIVGSGMSRMSRGQSSYSFLLPQRQSETTQRHTETARRHTDAAHRLRDAVRRQAESIELME